MDHFPLFAELTGAPCLVVGGGLVGHRKVLQLVRAGACVTVNAPALCAELEQLVADQTLDWQPGPFAPQLVETCLLVIAATDDDAVNRRVAAAAKSAYRLCNVVDNAALSTFIMPSVIDRSPVLIAVSTGGASPVLARLLRQRIDDWLPTGIGRLARWASGLRQRVRDRLPDIDARRRFWERVLDGDAAEHVIANRHGLAERAVADALGEPAAATPAGIAWLVGAGPGDPGLLSRRGLEILQRADVVLHDRLVPREILDLGRRDARYMCVGKQAGGSSWAQADINRLLVELVGQGQRVCRLKGGDPFVFGRGGEELQALAQAGLPFEVVPGISAASGCPAYSGIPLTHRGLAGSVTLLTARREAGQAEPDWASLVNPDQTLVFYMGSRMLDDIAQRLIAAGRAATTPAAIIEHGTKPDQHVVRGTLAEIGQLGADAGAGSPSLLIVGDVAALGAELEWFAGTRNATTAAANG